MTISVLYSVCTDTYAHAGFCPGLFRGGKNGIR